MPSLLHGLLAEAAGLGFQIQIGLGPAYDRRADEAIRLRSLAPWARGGLLLLSGGPLLFERFAAAQDRAAPAADPLDDWTRAQIDRLVGGLRQGGIAAAARFPFWNEPAPLPFQRIGAAAGLGAPSLLGLTLDRDHGAWIAYRALILLDREVEEPQWEPFNACEACAAPCIPACPADAIQRSGFDAARCFDHRLDAGDPCADGCHARLACPAPTSRRREGSAPRYGNDALRFHQAASLATARMLRKPPPD